jgi:hypothetical protein
VNDFFFLQNIILRILLFCVRIDGTGETKEGDKNLIILFIKRGKVRLNPLSLSLSFSIHTHTHTHTSTLTQNDGRSAWAMTKLWVSKRTAVKTSFFANQKIRRMRCMQFAHYFSFFQSYHKFLLTSFYYCTPSSPYLLILLLNTYTIFFKTENFILNLNSKLYLILPSVLVKSNN